jgi:hypothetical protein
MASFSDKPDGMYSSTGISSSYDAYGSHDTCFNVWTRAL